MKLNDMKDPMQVVILMPLRDDWQAASLLIRSLDQVLHQFPAAFQILVVDDGSEEPARPGVLGEGFAVIDRIQVLRLKRNLGHQRAIAIGLARLQLSFSGQAVLIMDSDGEDTPEGVLQLLSKFSEEGGVRAIFAERVRRSESLQFRISYDLYRGVHYCLTGIRVRVGNFSILPVAYLNTLSVVSETWNHYAASVFRSKLPFTMTPIPRGHRIAGLSRMNFAALVGHGLSAISVFGDLVGVRVLIGSLIGLLLSALAIVGVLSIRLFTQEAVPGWATFTMGILIIVMMQIITVASTFTFFMLSNRSTPGFIPARDHALFIESIQDVYQQD